MIYSTLKASSLFQDLDDEQLSALSMAGTVVSLPAGHHLFREGDEADCIYIILQGTVKIYKSLDNGSDIEINSLSVGNVVGEIALIDDDYRSASAVAEMVCQLYAIERTVFLSMLSKHPQLAARLISLITSKLRESDAVRVRETYKRQALQAEMAQHQADEYVRRRIQEELRVARLIQMSLLPQQVPDLTGWQVNVHYEPAREVGGDIYDFIDLDDGRIGFVVGDASDKSIPAALVMSTIRSILRYVAEQLIAPGAVLERSNTLLGQDIPDKMFVTCFYAVLNPETGHLRYANAGHALPLRRVKIDTENGNGDSSVVELHARGMPLGLIPGMHYEENEVIVEPGDQVLFYSDGLVEARNSEGQMFGHSRLQKLMKFKAADINLIDALLLSLTEYADSGQEQEDDIMLLTLKRDA